MIIITNDADFSLKVLNNGYPPKVIHLKIGNLRIRELHDIMARNWINIESLIEDSCLLNVYIPNSVINSWTQN